LLRFSVLRGAKVCKSCRSRKMLKIIIWLQKSALIQPRTSPLKFDNLAENRSKIMYRIFQLWVHAPRVRETNPWRMHSGKQTGVHAPRVRLAPRIRRRRPIALKSKGNLALVRPTLFEIITCGYRSKNYILSI